MNDEIKTEPEEDEENLKVTPVRPSLPDNEAANRLSEDEQETESPAIGKVLESDVEVKSEIYEIFGDTRDVIETLVAGSTIVQEQPKTPERLSNSKNKELENDEYTAGSKVVNVGEPIGRNLLVDDTSTVTNVTIGNVGEPTANFNVGMLNQQITDKEEGSQNQIPSTPKEIQNPSTPTESESSNKNHEEMLVGYPYELNKNVIDDVVQNFKPTEPHTPSSNIHPNVEFETNSRKENPANLTSLVQSNTESKESTQPQITLNSFPLKTSEVAANSESGMVNNETIDFDITLAKSPPSNRSTGSGNTASVIAQNENPSHIAVIPVKMEPPQEYCVEPMDFEETLARPVLSAPETETEPPPPPSMSEIRAIDFLDGIATPRITLAPFSRLRVKSEITLTQPSQTNHEISALPKDFFEDLLTVDKHSQSGDSTPTHDEPIPDNFFDDLLTDQIKERIEEAKNDELEEKFSDRLKELHELEKKERKKNKKQKKSKKKSHKRSRSRSPPTTSRERDRNRPSPIPSHSKNKRSRVSPPLNQLSTASNYGNLTKVTRSRSRSPPTTSRERDRNRPSPIPTHSKNKRSHVSPPLNQLSTTSNYGNLTKVTRLRSRSPPTTSRERDRNRTSPIPSHSKNKRSRVSPPLNQLSTASNYGNLTKVTTDNVRSLSTTRGIQVKSEFNTFDLTNTVPLNHGFNEDIEMMVNPVKVESQINCEEIYEIEEILTPKQKRERALMRASSLISRIADKPCETNSILSTFQYTSTVRKLPTSHSYVHQQIYENRSPLHTVNNVVYKFNSHATRFNMEEWGLATLPTHAAKTAKLIGCDAQTIHNKLKTIKIPAKLQKIKSEQNDLGEEEVEITSSFFCNSTTQTDDVEDVIQLKPKGYEIGVQAEPSVCNIGCQTLETQSPTKNNQTDQDEVPIMKIMHDLNENQLMAIHDFAELIKEPAANAMDMYTLRMRMLEIYKCSQLPSALDVPQTSVINNYTTTTNSPKTHRRSLQMQQPIIQSVSSADGKHFSINDPRANSAAYTSRGSGGGSSYDSRYSAFSQPFSKPTSTSDPRQYSTSPYSTSSSQECSASSQQQPSSSTTKFYGRGGLRR